MTPSGLRLLLVGPHHRRALQHGRDALQALLGVSVPDGWPAFPEAFAPDEGAADAAQARWPGFLFLCPAEGALVGNGGFAGAPDALGEVEIGYEVAPAHRNRGHATAAAAQLLALAFAQPEVTAVVAHTLAEASASTAVLRKLGMSRVAALPDAEAGTVWKWRVPRPSPLGTQSDPAPDAAC